MQRITIPAQLTPVEAINSSKFIVNCSPDPEFIYDFSNMQHCHPFGLLLLGSAIRRNINHYKKAKHTPYGYNGTQGCEFAADLGFFQYCGWDIGRKTNIFDYGVNHIPIKCIGISDLRKDPTDMRPLGDLIDEHARDLAITLTQDNDSEATKTLQYCLREIIRNTFEHGRTNQVWVCGQYWSSRNEAEIALIDEGRGILSSLQTNRRYRLTTDIEANKLALQPGASRMLGIKQDPYDIWQNSGYGLFMSSALCGLGGYFVLGSGKNATLVNAEKQIPYESEIKGTAICMNIKTDQILNLQDRLDELAAIGRVQAEQNAEYRILTASKVSTIASLIRNTSGK